MQFWLDYTQLQWLLDTSVRQHEELSINMASSAPEEASVADTSTGIDIAATDILPYDAERKAALPEPYPTDEIHADGGLRAWLQMAASFALYFNHL